ncbi:hypothetical protein TMES_16135 [Thalassospira mesophila]|uniref:Uncharacterized protein n=1 Tax=Thalassospira mesophila TaxID=1293891 RepID=A0A1Y2KZX8_9PROT|nr:hypothetical protein TMES_16135 [Thalassospira mesophila]
MYEIVKWIVKWSVRCLAGCTRGLRREKGFRRSDIAAMNVWHLTSNQNPSLFKSNAAAQRVVSSAILIKKQPCRWFVRGCDTAKTGPFQCKDPVLYNVINSLWQGHVFAVQSRS